MRVRESSLKSSGRVLQESFDLAQESGCGPLPFPLLTQSAVFPTHRPTFCGGAHGCPLSTWPKLGLSDESPQDHQLTRACGAEFQKRSQPPPPAMFSSLRG